MTKQPSMVVLGFGRMGRHYTRLFVKGFDVAVHARSADPSAVEALGARPVADSAAAVRDADYVVLAVPLGALASVVAAIRAELRPDAVVVDLCSARVRAAEALADLPCRHLGLHDLAADELCLCGEADARLEQFLSDHGYRIRHLDAAAHDRLNAIVGTAHFLGMVAGTCLTREEREVLTGSPAGRHLLDLIAHLHRNAPSTYTETQIDNAFTAERRRRLIEAMARADEELSAGRFPFPWEEHDVRGSG